MKPVHLLCLAAPCCYSRLLDLKTYPLYSLQLFAGKIDDESGTKILQYLYEG